MEPGLRNILVMEYKSSASCYDIIKSMRQRSLNDGEF